MYKTWELMGCVSLPQGIAAIVGKSKGLHKKFKWDSPRSEYTCLTQWLTVT